MAVFHARIINQFSVPLFTFGKKTRQRPGTDTVPQAFMLQPTNFQAVLRKQTKRRMIFSFRS